MIPCERIGNLRKWRPRRFRARRKHGCQEQQATTQHKRPTREGTIGIDTQRRRIGHAKVEDRKPEKEQRKDAWLPYEEQSAGKHEPKVIRETHKLTRKQFFTCEPRLHHPIGRAMRHAENQ